MDSVQQLIETLQGVVQPILNAVIILVALVFIGVMIVRAIASFKGSKMTDGFKYVGFALIIALIAALGIGGVTFLMDILKGTLESSGALSFDNEF